MEEGKEKNNSVVWIIIILLIMGGFIGGYFIGSSSKKCEEKCEEKCEKTPQENNDEKVAVDVRDKFAISTYVDALKFYIISDGKVYYKLSNELFAGLNVCPETDDYCISNTGYNNKVNEISEISDAIKIKSVVDLKASDESFIYFVITKNKVYKLWEAMDMDGNYTGVKVELVEELSNKDIVDLTNYDDGSYIFVTSNGGQVKY